MDGKKRDYGKIGLAFAIASPSSLLLSLGVWLLPQNSFILIIVAFVASVTFYIFLLSPIPAILFGWIGLMRLDGHKKTPALFALILGILEIMFIALAVVIGYRISLLH
jgi:hypothetical protein